MLSSLGALSSRWHMLHMLHKLKSVQQEGCPDGIQEHRTSGFEFASPNQCCLWLQALSLLEASSHVGAAACALSNAVLQRGLAASAWQLLQCCLPAACQKSPTTALAVVEALHKQRRHVEVSFLAE